MKTDDELKQMVEQEFYSDEARAEIGISVRHFLLNRLTHLWHMVLQLKNRLGGLDEADRIEPLGKHAIYDDLGNTEGMAYASKAEMHNKINEIIERLNRIQGKEE